MLTFVAYGQFLASRTPAPVQDLAAVFAAHSLSETMFVLSFPVAGLKCPFHLILKVYPSTGEKKRIALTILLNK
jgi:hypothetical protein